MLYQLSYASDAQTPRPVGVDCQPHNPEAQALKRCKQRWPWQSPTRTVDLRPMKSWRWVLALAFVGPSWLGACDGATSGAAGGPGATKGKSTPVKVFTVQDERVERVVELTGTLVGTHDVVVSAEGEGRVEHVAADLGDVVAAGAPLVVLAREAPRLQVAQADAEYATALARAGTDDAGLDSAGPEQASAVRRAAADADEAAANLKRVRELFEKSVASSAELDAATARARMTEAALAAARDDALANLATAKSRRAALGLAKKRLADATIASPVDGMVAQRLVSLGEVVKPLQPVMRVVQTHPLKLRGDIPERYADVVTKGLALEVTVDSAGATVRGVVSRVGPVIDDGSRTFPIEAQLGNADGRLKPGTFARARVVIADDEVVFALPETAVSNVAGVTKVFVAVDDVAVERRVQLLRKRGSDALLSGDLKAGDRVIVTAIARLFPGAPVQIDATDAQPSTTAPGTSAKEAR
jgi:membrane fusion protein (multidrug efflux system)